MWTGQDKVLASAQYVHGRGKKAGVSVTTRCMDEKRTKTFRNPVPRRREKKVSTTTPYMGGKGWRVPEATFHMCSEERSAPGKDAIFGR